MLFPLLKNKISLTYSFLKTKKDIVFLFFCLLIACFFIFHHIGERTFWGDEAGVAIMVEQPFYKIPNYAINDAHPLFYAALIKLWSLFFTNTEVSLRVFSAVFGLLTIFLTWKIVKDFFGNKIANIAAFFLSTNYFLIFYSIQVKTYTLAAFLGLLSCYFFLKLFSDRRFLFPYLITTTASIYTHPWLLFIFVCQIAFTVLVLKRNNQKQIIICQLAIVIVSIPELIIAEYQGVLGVTNWIGKISFNDFLSSFKYLSGYDSSWIYLAFLVIGGVFWLNRIYREEVSVFGKEEREIFLFFGLCFVLPIILALIISRFIPVYVVGRYEMSILPFFIIIIAVLLGKTIPSDYIFCLIFIALIISAKSSVISEASLISNYVSNDKIIAEDVIKNAKNGDTVVVADLAWATFSYYFERADEDNKSISIVPFPEEIRSHPGWENKEKISKELLKYEKEAMTLAGKLKEEGGNVWLITDSNQFINNILVDSFEKEFSLKAEKIPEEPRSPSWINRIIFFVNHE